MTENTGNLNFPDSFRDDARSTVIYPGKYASWLTRLLEGSADARLLKADWDLLPLTFDTTEAYTADLHIEDLQINHFLAEIPFMSSVLLFDTRARDSTYFLLAAAALKATVISTLRGL